MIFDNSKEISIAQLEQGSNVLSVSLRSDKVIVCTEDRINVYEMPSFTMIEQIFTCQNPLGVFSSSADGPFIIACPSLETV